MAWIQTINLILSVCIFGLLLYNRAQDHKDENENKQNRNKTTKR